MTENSNDEIGACIKDNETESEEIEVMRKRINLLSKTSKNLKDILLDHSNRFTDLSRPMQSTISSAKASFNRLLNYNPGNSNIKIYLTGFLFLSLLLMIFMLF